MSERVSGGSALLVSGHSQIIVWLWSHTKKEGLECVYELESERRLLSDCASSLNE